MTLQRKTPIARKRAAPRRRPAARCAWSNRCKRRPSIVIDENERLCTVHSKIVADKVVGDWVKHVRDERCLYCGTDQDLEWAHIRSRGAHPALHWHVGPTVDEPGNTTTLCRGHHFMFTKAPARWEVFVEQTWPGLYGQLISAELTHMELGTRVDIAEVIRTYRSKAAA